ncbi:MAG: hypothetical protein EAY81_05055 [Bacteroidetes bacterium]|nr:MAG: hypothetical protein EAY81_05055 [Bacteroidota bacterium]
MTNKLTLILFLILTISCGLKYLKKKQRRQTWNDNIYNDKKLSETRQKIYNTSDTIFEICNGQYYWLYKTKNNNVITSAYRNRTQGQYRFKISSHYPTSGFDSIIKFIIHNRIDTVLTSPKTDFGCDHCPGYELTLLVKKDTITHYWLETIQIGKGDSTHIKWKLSLLTNDYIKNNYR